MFTMKKLWYGIPRWRRKSMTGPWVRFATERKALTTNWPFSALVESLSAALRSACSFSTTMASVEPPFLVSSRTREEIFSSCEDETGRLEKNKPAKAMRKVQARYLRKDMTLGS